ncbi:MAG: phosphatidylglycerophosphatase A [Campylobacterota bacterium]
MNFRWFFLTGAYSGLFPKAPGTAGTLAALPAGVAVLAYFGSQTLFLASLLITLIALKAINAYEAQSGIHDDKRIVIDEVVGMWLALSIAPGATFAWPELARWENGLMVQIVLAFLFFRLYDIKKPSVIGRIDREAKGGWGVMGDDILAGFAAGISSAIVWQLLLKTPLFS